ncbi:ubiquitin-conjugating enzyme E2-24 kDa [Cordyceps militaris CM01]|uniref:Ubiquitin-conjugating enzyme E2 2 n=1 Tax=Cordyceps militaris (strain CM01) TaxID=983644 RepID=G3JLZ5_CORMM|nr:ubiquitin-conjugating enzyme E2-24 kDa [Cordyceps militaris CM01]EGX90719.1 ubiquitin-conjugating enzyme E2-24 kDa [Cordyceps militaris CM01]
MTTSRDRRVAKELADIHADQDSSGVFAAPADGVSLRSLVGIFPAPPDTPYAGGTYEVEVDIPDSYPFKPPKMRFKTKIWHPNVSSQTGAICLDTLTTGWSPVQTIKTALLSLRMLLEFPNSKDPQDAEVAKMMNEHPESFALFAHEWAVKYAGAPRRTIDTSQFAQPSAAAPVDDAQRYNGYNKRMVDKFTSMGFDVEAVVDAFRLVGIDRNNGHYYELEEAYMGEITARLLGEQ